MVTLEGKMMINQNRPDFWIPDHSHHAHMKLIFLQQMCSVGPLQEYMCEEVPAQVLLHNA